MSEGTSRPYGENVRRQPSLHEHLTCVAAPATWLSPPSGQLTGGVDGLYVSDRRVLSRLLVTLDGAEPEPRHAELRGADGARFTATAGALTVERLRTVRHDGGTERITVRNDGGSPVTTRLSVTAAADFAQISDVKAGDPAPPETELRDGAVQTGPGGYEVRLDGPADVDLTLEPGEHVTTTFAVRATPPPGPGFRPAPPDGPPPWSRAPLTVRSADERIGALVAQGIADLGALLLADEGDLYCGAGSPWYLTLFGRDALWTARLALPLGHELAAGTLRALARHQGTGHDPVTEEEPGKIPHELRPAHAPDGCRRSTTDRSTPRRCSSSPWPRRGAGACPPPRYVRSCPPPGRPWPGYRTFEEFVSYRGSAERLPNQGWKDSGDGVQHEDGTLAIAADRAGGGAGVRLPGGHARRGPARRVRQPAATTTGAGRRGWPHGSASGSGWTTATRRSRSTGRAGPSTASPRTRAPARHRPAHPGGGGPRRGAADGAALRMGPADADRPRGRVRPAVVPPRLGLAARHRDRDARPEPLGPHRTRRDARARADRGRAGVRVPAARAVRRAGRRDRPCPIRRPAARRRGAPPCPRRWSPRCSASTRTCPPGARRLAPLPGFGAMRIGGVRLGGAVSSFTVDEDGRRLVRRDRPRCLPGASGDVDQG